jgi:hypothetical protein
MLEKEIAIDWPTPQDYNEAVQNPRTCFADEQLCNSRIATNKIGLPHAASGSFASVYKATTGDSSWAVRCFLNNRSEQKARYEHISEFVLFDNLESTVDFYYLDQGIKVRGKWYPCLKMTWVDGLTLDRYIEQSYSDTNKMTNLLKGFHQMVGELEGAGIGHGDLQHGNIIVTDKGLRLVDYDTLFVPALSGLKSLEFGHPNYQHPQRNENHFDPNVDNFSRWLIHASIFCLAVDPTLYKTLGGGDECILFRRKDLLEPDDSMVFKTLLEHESEHIRQTASIIRRMLWAAPNTIPHLGAPPEDLEQLPKSADEAGTQGRAHLPVATRETGSQPIYAENTESDSPSRGLAGDDANQTTVLPFDFAGAYDAIDSSVVDRQKQKLNPGLQFARLTQSTFKAGRQAKDRIQRVADKLELSTIPSNWIARKLKEASELYFDAEYVEAGKVYLEIFKQLDQNKHQLILSEVAISLGYCFGMNSQYSVAANYFLLFLNEGKRRFDIDRRKNEVASDEIRDAAFLLAICKFDDGNEAAAVKVISDYQVHFIDLAQMVSEERRNVYIYRWNTFRFLRAAALKLAKSKEDATLIYDLVKSASIIFMQLLMSEKHDCSEELLDSYMELIGIMPKLESMTVLTERTKKLYFAFAEACYAKGFNEQGKTASFCGAVLQNSLEGSQNEAMLTLANLGQTNVEDFARLALQAVKYLRASSIMRMLVNVSHFFKQMDVSTEALDALRVASRIAPLCDSGESRLVVDALETLDDVTILSCLADSYFAASCPHRVRDDFILRLADFSSQRVLSTAIQLVVASEPLPKLAVLFHKLAERSDRELLHHVLVAGARVPGEKDSEVYANIINEACEIAAKTAIENLKPAISPIDNERFHNFAWNHYYAQIDVLDNLRYHLIKLEDLDGAKNFFKLLVSDDYIEVVTNWFFNLVSTGGFNKYFGFVLELAKEGRLDWLEKILSMLVSNGHMTVLDGILKQLVTDGHLSVLFDLALALAEGGKLVVFANIVRELARSAESSQLIELTEATIACRNDGTVYTSTIVTHLLQQKQSHKAARLLVHLHQNGKLSRLSFDFHEILSTAYPDSIFDKLVRQSEFDTLAELTCCIATTMNLSGLRTFYNLLQTGASSEDGFKVTQLAFEQCCTKLDALLYVPALFDEQKIIDPELQTSYRELNSSMEALHKIRGFIGRENLERLIAQGPNNIFSQSINDKYLGLSTAWAVDLARQHNLILLNSYALELALLGKRETLIAIAKRLAIEEKRNALYGLTSHLLLGSQLQSVLDIGLSLAVDHVYDAKGVLAQVVREAPDESSIYIVIERSAEVNPVLADLMVRHLAFVGRADLLKPMALRFANYNKTVALHLVLTQLLAMDQDFLPLLRRLCDTQDQTEIEAIATWLVSGGLTDIIQERVENLHVFNQLGLAAEWERFLPSKNSDEAKPPTEP